ncbi:MAG: DoxX family membrane protein [Anaerolineales bacterium]
MLRILFDRVDTKLTSWMARYGILLLRVSLGIVFLWFGVLKFFPGLSPAEDLAARTISQITFGMLPAATAVFILAAWESLIGIGLILGLQLRVTLFLLWVQMLGTVTPIFFFPNEVFTVFPYAPTLEGQYIFKNVVLVSAGLVIGATVRGGRVVAEPDKIIGKARDNLA